MLKNKLIFIALLALTLTLALSGCGGADDALEGKYIVTFEVNGGILNFGTSSTNSKINFAYHPGTYIKDPTTIANYSISRNGYDFTGWYTSPECKENEKWDFEKTLDVETLVLYAGWEKSIRHTYDVCFMDGENVKVLGSYKVNAGDKFDDWSRYANKREGYTSIGYYQDPECLIPWDDSFTHPGGDTDCSISVYAKYIEGEWVLVDSYDKLKNAISSSNVYLTGDIDCGGAELFFSNEFNKVFEGNGYTISNFKIEKSGTIINPALAMFKSLGQNAVLKNVNFDNVIYEFYDIAASTDKVEVVANVAALAISMKVGAKVENVSINGTLNTNYTGDLPCLNDPYYHKGEIDAEIMAGVSNFVVNITVDKQS